MDNPEKLATQGTQDEEKQNKNNPEKLATQGAHDEDKQNKNTTQYVMDITICKQTQKTYIRHGSSYKQLQVKINQKAEIVTDRLFRTQRHIIGQHKKHLF